jgi:hypothetical protein
MVTVSEKLLGHSVLLFSTDLIWPASMVVLQYWSNGFPPSLSFGLYGYVQTGNGILLNIDQKFSSIGI